MKKIIFIKYAELNTKKDNINFFLDKLKKNIEFILEGMNVNVIYDKGRMFIETNDVDMVINKLYYVFGIHSIVIAYKMNNSFEEISSNLLELIKDKDFNTFKVSTKRSNKNYPMDSMEISRKLGGVVLKNIPNKKVDVHNPELLINVEIRKDYAYLYIDEFIGCGGYPVGTSGKTLLMLSGGIDSPVAGYMAMKRGLKIECIYFAAPPHTSLDAQDKVLSLAKKLALYNCNIKVHIINFTEIEEAIYRYLPKEYLITIMRRMMYRITTRIAKKIKAKAIVNGESIGQVASQTLDSISCIGCVTDMPVIRPLACLDKLEIIDIAKRIDTYEISILPYEDCCTIFVPDHPVINPKRSLCEEYEKLIPYEDMINKCINEEEIIKIDINSNNSNDLL